MRVIFYIIIFYILYKGFVFFLKFISGARKNPYNDIRNPKQNTQNQHPKNRDIEEADYREIKDDDDDKS